MGTVYEAIDERVSAVVALKEASNAADAASHREFEREAKLLANLHHQSLPKVMDYFTEGSGEYLVMEFVPGYDLAELLKRRGAPFHVKLVLRWADELLDVLEYLHGLNPPILHRDIKPANLKLTQREEIYLLDFGLAKGTTGKMTAGLASRSVRGYTPVYASLEQILGQGTDARSDLYSLGATLYHLLTAELPADAPARDEQIEDGKPDPLLHLQGLNPKVPEAVTAEIHRALAIRRKNRPESAAEMRRALRVAIAEADDDDDEARASREKQPREEGAGAITPTQQTVPIAIQPQTGGAKGKTQEFHPPAPARRKSQVVLITAAVVVAGILIIATALMIRRGLQSKREDGVNPAPLSQTTKPTPSQQSGQSYSENVNGVSLELLAIPAGTFMMGAPQFEMGSFRNECPQHSVSVPGFYMSKYEITQAQWQAVMGSNPSGFRGDTRPVESVSWNEATEYCKRLSLLTGHQYRLPTEAEWEYACRAGTTGPYAGMLDKLAWYSANSGAQTHPVGQAQPNGFGLYDMHGNVWEWCQDVDHENYDGAPTDGSAWLRGGDQTRRVLRGGAWNNNANLLRSAYRGASISPGKADYVGFRVVAEPRTR